MVKDLRGRKESLLTHRVAVFKALPPEADWEQLRELKAHVCVCVCAWCVCVCVCVGTPGTGREWTRLWL